MLEGALGQMSRCGSLPPCRRYACPIEHYRGSRSSLETTDIQRVVSKLPACWPTGVESCRIYGHEVFPIRPNRHGPDDIYMGRSDPAGRVQMGQQGAVEVINNQRQVHMLWLC